jgi:hypothetical protein
MLQRGLRAMRAPRAYRCGATLTISPAQEIENAKECEGSFLKEKGVAATACQRRSLNAFDRSRKETRDTETPRSCTTKYIMATHEVTTHPSSEGLSVGGLP